MKVNCKEDCGNAPLKEMIRDFNIAFGQGDVESIAEKLTDDMVWEMMGEHKFVGKEKVVEELEKMKEYTASELSIDHIITHGKAASCNGSFIMKEGGAKYAFCDVYDFDKSGKNARIKKMISFGIKIN
ncbi:MAG: nuclear transport factor 2 family protein [Vicingaceae bacterium]